MVHEAVIRLLGDAGLRQGRRTGASCSRRPHGPCGRSSSTTRGGGPPTGAAGAGSVSRSTWWSTTSSQQELDVVAVHEALDRLAELNERQSQVMTLRYFGGLTVPEVAAALGVSVVTVERDWRLARAWLHGQLREADR